MLVLSKALGVWLVSGGSRRLWGHSSPRQNSVLGPPGAPWHVVPFVVCRGGTELCHRDGMPSEMGIAACSIFIMGNDLTKGEFRLITFSLEK